MKPILFSLFTFLALVVYTSLFISTGLEVTDTGFNLYNQMAIWKGWAEYSFGMVWLADWLGGLWQLVTPIQGLLGVYWGWSLLIGVTALLCFYFLNSFTSPLASLLLTVTTGVTLLPGRLQFIYYDNIAALMLLTSGFCLYKLSYNNISRRKYWVLIATYGITCGSVVFVKFPAILGFVFFPIILLTFSVLLKNDKKQSLYTCIHLLLSSFLVTTFILILLWLLGGIDRYLESLFKGLGLIDVGAMKKDYQLSQLLQRYWFHYTWQIKNCFFVLAGLIGLKSVEYFSFKISSVTIQKLIQTLSAVAFFFLIYYLIENNENDFRALAGSLALTLSFIILLLYRFFTAHARLALTLAIFITFASFAGSNIGFLNISHGLWFLLPLSLLYYSRVSLKKESKSAFLAIAILFPLAFKAYSIRLQSPFRDLSTRETLISEVNHPKLVGVKTTEKRARSLSELFNHLEEKTKPGDSLIAYNSIPLVHYVTETRPFFGDPWPTLHGTNAIEYYIEKTKNQTLPRYAVRAITNTQSTIWGNGQLVKPHDPISYNATLMLDKWLHNNGFRPIWNNQDFVILSR